jgi:hypothetical protein
MSKQLVKDILGWGILLWLFGYVLGIALFMVVPPAFLGWVIMPMGATLTIWVLLKKVKTNYRWLAIGWTMIAMAFDYFFLVKVFKPADGYYKLDVYMYYGLTFVLPLIVGHLKRNEDK